MFINALIKRMISHRDFEAVQAFLKVFMNIHAEVIIENIELSSALQKLLDVHKEESEKILELVASSLGTLGFVRTSM
jgi:U3 small nucleolar RNA-associated protein 21